MRAKISELTEINILIKINAWVIGSACGLFRIRHSPWRYHQFIIGGLYGSEQRASPLARNSVPPAPDAETRRVSSELCWFACSFLLSPLLAVICRCNLRCQGGAGEYEISWPTSNFIPSWWQQEHTGSSPSSLIPAKAATGEHRGRVTPGALPALLVLLVSASCFWVSFRLLTH